MAFCANAEGTAAALVDIEPVTFGEIENHRVLTTNEFEGEYASATPATMAYNSSRRIAQRLATLASDAANDASGAATAVRFGLPPDGYRTWPDCAAASPAPTVVPRADFYPAVERPYRDVAIGGFAYFRSGVREWTQKEVVGVSAIQPNLNDAARRTDTGFRLALELVPLTR
jgi:hypothetical protein